MTRRRIEGLRVPPHNVEAEQSVLGGLMLRADALVEFGDWLGEDDFYRRDHQLIYRAIRDLVAQELPCDAVTLGEWFESNALSEQVGGTRYVLELANTTPSAANIVAYAEIVLEKSRLRQAIEIGTDITTKGFDPAARAADVFAAAATAIAAHAGDNRTGGPRLIDADVAAWHRGLVERYDRDERVSGVPTPWPDVTELLSGWQPGEIYLLAGRPKMGKSVLGAQAAFHAALDGRRTLMFSLEMRREQCVQRAVACFGEISHEGLRKPWLLDDEEWPRVTAMTAQLRSAALLIDDQPRLSAPQIIARMKREHLRHSLQLVVIDHLHEIGLPKVEKFGELAEAVRQIRAAGKELGVPILLLAQLNRANATRSDHRPILTDLRGDGGLDEVCDVALFIHRQDYYERDTHLKGVVELIVGAGRDVPTGTTIHLANRYDQMRLDPWVGDLPKPAPKEPKEPKSKRRTLKDDASDYASKGGDA